MNIKLFYHAGLALVIQFLVFIFTTSIWLGAVVAIGFYVVREYREYKARVMANQEHWNTFNTLEVVFPAVSTTVAASLVMMFR